ncbi:MAG: 50S ribosomal protein L28 [Gammaproteobacteria bacterium RIFOXYB2_FULL_38_6]|nr:MAG: 50S ribosomal protein L28 [Gammaproteobacteria bacterium RIFOXYB2_FULL_38_6]
MSKVCAVTGKRPQVGHKVSHSNIKSKRRFMPNLKKHKFWLPNQNKFITLKVSTHGMRLIDKIGIEEALKRMDELQ